MALPRLDEEMQKNETSLQEKFPHVTITIDEIGPV